MQKMLSYVRRAVDHYHMIDEGDRIAVGVSGGKDSLALLVALSQLSRFYPHHFTVVAITLEMGYDEMDFSPVQTLCDKLGVEYIRAPSGGACRNATGFLTKIRTHYFNPKIYSLSLAICPRSSSTEANRRSSRIFSSSSTRSQRP